MSFFEVIADIANRNRLDAL